MTDVTSLAALRRHGKRIFSGALGWAVTLVIALSGLPSLAQTRGGTLNFIVTPEPTALVDLASSNPSRRSPPRGKSATTAANTFSICAMA
jgi:peptide/nickel transport system substrate-binding protein